MSSWLIENQIHEGWVRLLHCRRGLRIGPVLQFVQKMTDRVFTTPDGSGYPAIGSEIRPSALPLDEPAMFLPFAYFVASDLKVTGSEVKTESFKASGRRRTWTMPMPRPVSPHRRHRPFLLLRFLLLLIIFLFCICKLWPALRLDRRPPRLIRYYILYRV